MSSGNEDAKVAVVSKVEFYCPNCYAALPSENSRCLKPGCPGGKPMKMSFEPGPPTDISELMNPLPIMGERAL